MEGLIILFVIISAIQKIAEKVQEARKGKNPAEVQTRTPHPYTQSSQKEEVSADPLDIFRDWEQIFFPKDNETIAEDADGLHEEAYEESYEKPFAVEQPVTMQTKSVSTGMYTEAVNRQEARPQFQGFAKTAASNFSTFEDVGLENRVSVSNEMRSKRKLQVDREAVRQGILWSEILAAPKSSLHWRKYQRSSTRG